MSWLSAKRTHKHKVPKRTKNYTSDKWSTSLFSRKLFILNSSGDIQRKWSINSKKSSVLYEQYHCKLPKPKFCWYNIGRRSEFAASTKTQLLFRTDLLFLRNWPMGNTCAMTNTISTGVCMIIIASTLTLVWFRGVDAQSPWPCSAIFFFRVYRCSLLNGLHYFHLSLYHTLALCSISIHVTSPLIGPSIAWKNKTTVVRSLV